MIPTIPTKPFMTANALHNRAPAREARREPNGDAVWRSG
jgi:hypothetical protein